MKQLCTFLVLLASACAYGQTGPTAITSTQCAFIGVGPKVSVITFQVTGTWTGTLQPQITVQGQAAANVQVTPSTSSTAASTVTANGIYTAQVNGADTFQVCGNTVASGTANVFLNLSVASKGGSSGGGGSGTVTSVATTSPIGGGTITATGTVTCTTCVVASSPGAGVAHFAGSTQTATSSAVVAADITSGTITGTQLSSSIALPNGATATTQSASDNSTKVATTAYADAAAGSAACSTVTFSATPTFSGASNVTCFKITLTGDVTGSTCSNLTSGRTYTFIAVQDSTGTRGFAACSQMKEYQTWMAPPSQSMTQSFVYDGTNLNSTQPVNPDTRPFTAKTVDEYFDGSSINTSSKWTWTNQGTSTLSITNYGSGMFAPQQGSASFNVRYVSQAVPATPWTVLMKTTVFNNGGNVNQRIGMCVSDGTKLDMLNWNASGMLLEVNHYTTTTSGATAATQSQSGGTTLNWVDGQTVYFQVQDDGTNLNFYIGSSRNNMYLLRTELRGSFLTTGPTTVGICGEGTNAAAATILLYQDVKFFQQTQ